MGIFANLLKTDKAVLPEEKRAEFAKRAVELLDRGGMMKLYAFNLYGQQYVGLKRLMDRGDGVSCYYNYFDDDTSEDAGFDHEKLSFWSNKLVGARFYKVMLAAYALESEYYTGLNIISNNGSLDNGEHYLKWINFLFDEKYIAKCNDSWDAYMALRGTEYENYYDFNIFRSNGDKFLGCLDVVAAEEGISNVREVYQHGSPYESEDVREYRLWRFSLFEDFYKELVNFKNTSKLNHEQQLEYLLAMLQDIYINKIVKYIMEKYKADGYEDLFMRTFVYDSPATTVRAIAELYEQNFWKLWDKVSGVAKRSIFVQSDAEVLSTEDFLNVTADDLVLYWTVEKPIEFSSEMKVWLNSLKNKYDSILLSGVDLKRPMRRVKDVLDFAEQNYSHVYIFNDIIDETMDRFSEAEFMALWTLFDFVLHDVENLEANKALIEPAEGYKDEVGYVGKYHRICDFSWRNLTRKYKFNSGRKNIRRFIALLANKELRMKVLGV